MVKPLIFQIVGYQNSGKTTFTTKLIEVLSEQGLKVVTIKHHGHGGKPDAAPQQKDSDKHLSSGALASLVEGEGSIILQADYSQFSLEDQIDFLKWFKPDVILIEGHKQKDYPKLLLLRNQQDLSLKDHVSNVKVVACWEETIVDEVKENWKVPVFLLSDDRLLQSAVHYIYDNLTKV